MSILITNVRVAGFRGLENVEVKLERTTILTGMNNVGKTSFLKALQVALGNRQFISQDDFFIHGNLVSEKVTIDILINPTNEQFDEDVEILLTTDRIRTNQNGDPCVPVRTILTFDTLKNAYKTEQYILPSWPMFIDGLTNWFDTQNGNKTRFHFDEFPFFYMDAQRDIIEDTRLKNSYLGRMLSKVEYSEEDILAIETQIEELNLRTVSSSPILSNIKTSLQHLDSALDSDGAGIELTPFTKKMRDLSKGLSIYYTDNQDSFSMEYHGMGTRSWSSLLILKSFISLLQRNAQLDNSVFFPILCLEEPEAHLHPNAQKKLYSQMNDVVGQKIISTHSPYIAAAAKLEQIRNFYKSDKVNVGQIDVSMLSNEEQRKIRRQVINTRGEIFFSKLIVLFEGETEEQALPILFEKFFNKSPVEMGVDFIGVGGYNSYLPFLRFTKYLKIPTLILSDSDNELIVSKVKEQFLDVNPDLLNYDDIIFFDAGNDFERQLINDGFQSEIKETILSFVEYKNEQHRAATFVSQKTQIDGYSDDELYSKITSHKTKYGPAIAQNIIDSVHFRLPPNIIKLFDKIRTNLVRIEG